MTIRLGNIYHGGLNRWRVYGFKIPIEGPRRILIQSTEGRITQRDIGIPALLRFELIAVNPDGMIAWSDDAEMAEAA